MKNIIKIYKSVNCPSRLRRRKGVATLVLCVQPIRSCRQGGGSVSFDRSTVILSPCLLHHSPRKTRPSRARARFSPGNHHSNSFRKPHALPSHIHTSHHTCNIPHTSSIHPSATCNAITATHSLSQLPSLAPLLYKYKHFPFAS